MELGPRPKGYFMYKVLAGLLLIITFLVAASMIIARQNALDVPQAHLRRPCIYRATPSPAPHLMGAFPNNAAS